MARSASSLPGIGTSTSSGSQFVSTTPITGIFSLRASATAIASLRVSMTKTASGTRLHALDAGQVLLELARAPFEVGELLLGEPLVLRLLRAGERHLELAQPLEAAAHGHEVGEQPAQPALGHVGHAAALGLLGDRLLGLALGADEQDVLALGGQVLHELQRVLEQPVGLLQVDDVDPVALAEDVLLHLRVPAAGLVPEVDARFEQVLHADARGDGAASGAGVVDGGLGQRRPPSVSDPGRTRTPGAFRPLAGLEVKRLALAELEAARGRPSARTSCAP